VVEGGVAACVVEGGESPPLFSVAEVFPAPSWFPQDARSSETRMQPDSVRL
jgi:hypothetical protein